MKTAVSIPDPIFDDAEQLAIRLGLSRSALYTRALVEYLQDHTDLEITGRLNRLYDDEPSGIDPRLIRIQTQAVRQRRRGGDD